MSDRYIPQLHHHKASGLAVVRINGKDRYCGRWGTPAAQSKYHRLVAEYLATGDPDAEYDPLLTMADVAAAWLQHCHEYYVKNGKPTSEVAANIAVQKYLLKLYCDLPVAEFGPKRLLAVRQSMIAANLCRKSINKNIGRIKRMFAWASEVEMIDPMLFHRLQCVKGLMPGRGGLETLPRRPASVPDFLAVAAAAPPVVAALLHLQYHTGMRPGEARLVRTGDIDRTGDIWIYRPGSFKTQHHLGKFRAIALGHNAQMILLPWLRDDDVSAWCFPARPGHPYSKDSYARAIARACHGCKITAHQLRHSFATRARADFDIDTVRAALGHTELRVTNIYIDRDTAAAVAVAAKIG